MIPEIDLKIVDLFMAHAEMHARESGNGRPFGLASAPRPIPLIGSGSGVSSMQGCPLASTLTAGVALHFAEGPAEIRGHVAAGAHAQPESRHRALLSIGVLEPYRGEGIGVELLGAAIRWATSQDALVWLTSRSSATTNQLCGSTESWDLPK